MARQVVVGAGPVGLLLAAELSRDGVEVLLIDRLVRRSFFCKALGITPRTLEIFDDLGFAPFLNPPLTTVRAPTESVGKIAAERLFSLLENQDSEEAVVLPTEIIFRRSCGCEHETQNS